MIIDCCDTFCNICNKPLIFYFFRYEKSKKIRKKQTCHNCGNILKGEDHIPELIKEKIRKERNIKIKRILNV